MNDQKVIGISDMAVVKETGSIITYALGSCIGLALYDKLTRTAGLAHIMLPAISEVQGATNKMKFADTAVDELIGRMTAVGALRANLVAKMAGGAQMFNVQSEKMMIGQRNIAAVKQQLARFGIRLMAEDTGLNYGRTVSVAASDGILVVKAISKPIREL